jgi:hypothetical protein
MDVFIWGTLGLLALVCVAVVLYGLSRLTASTAPADGSLFLEMDPVEAEINRALDPYMTYINAVRSGQRDALANAPLPEFYTEELLLEGLRRTQRQPSFYDALWEHSSQRFFTRLFAKTARTQAEYSRDLEQSAAAHNAFLRELAKRPDLQLEYEKIRSALQADIAHNNLRKAKADRERETPVEPAPQPPPSPPKGSLKPQKDRLDEEDTRFKQEIEYLIHSFGEHSDPVKFAERRHQDRVRKIMRGEQVDPI